MTAGSRYALEERIGRGGDADERRVEVARLAARREVLGRLADEAVISSRRASLGATGLRRGARSCLPPSAGASPA